jgi:hypothetical protein
MDFMDLVDGMDGGGCLNKITLSRFEFVGVGLAGLWLAD